MEPVNPYASPMAAGEEATSVAQGPLTLLGALQAGASLYVGRFPTLVAITLTVGVPLNLLVSYVEYFLLDSEDVLASLRLSMAADGLIGAFALGGIISVAEAELRGEHRGWLAGMFDGIRAWPRLFATRFVSNLALMLAAILLLLPAIYLAVRYSLADCASVIERRAGTSAISRSMDLTRGRFLTLFGLGAATFLPVVVGNIVLFAPLGFFPEWDHWLISAALGCVSELLDLWMQLVFVAAYVQCRSQDPTSPAI